MPIKGEIQGFWYDGQHSGQQAAVVRVDHRGYLTVLTADGKELHNAPADNITISSRLGNTSRYIYFANGEKFETRDNAAIDQLLDVLSKTVNSSFLYHLETRWHYVGFSIVIAILAGIWTFIYGVPLAAKGIANVLPPVLVQQAGEQTLEFLDDKLMAPSQLSEVEKNRITNYFQPIINDYPEQNIRLLFRHSEDLGANAFALPDGIIIFTDDMIALAENDDELLSVMAHEVGHVVHNHGMRNVIQGSLVGFVVMLMTGDVSGAGELFIGLPVLLTQLGYSRKFEREADDFALEYMLDHNLDPAHFSRLMSRLQHSHCEPPCEDAGWQKYLSTHPSTQERVEKFEQAGSVNAP